MFEDNAKHKFLFRCEVCKMIVSAEFEEEDSEDVREDKVILECPCGGQSCYLRD